MFQYDGSSYNQLIPNSSNMATNSMQLGGVEGNLYATKQYVDEKTDMKMYKKNLLMSHTFNIATAQDLRSYDFTISNASNIFKTYSGLLFYFQINNLINVYSPRSSYVDFYLTLQQSEANSYLKYYFLSVESNCSVNSIREIYYLSFCNQTLTVHTSEDSISLAQNELNIYTRVNLNKKLSCNIIAQGSGGVSVSSGSIKAEIYEF